MQYSLYIHAFAETVSFPMDNKTLRQQLQKLGAEGRRLSRFTQLSLLGALSLKEQVDENTALFLGSPFNSPSTFDKMFKQVMQQNFPSPLDFMANISNAALFHVAQGLQIVANSSFVAVDKYNYWQPLWLAYNELLQHPQQTALVGWAYEHQQVEEEEGSVWLLLSLHAEDAVAEISVPGILNKELAMSDFGQFLKPIQALAEQVRKDKGEVIMLHDDKIDNKLKV